MSLIIIATLIISYLLIATESVTKVNKAAIAIFAGTVGWVLYISWGTDFVMFQYENEYMKWLDGAFPTGFTVKQFIAQNIFLKHIGKAAEIVLFLLATMTIVEILNNNGCFDPLTAWLRTRNSRKLLWTMSFATFIISANLDNLTTTVMMLVLMHNMVSSHRQRIVYGSVIVIAANAGGALTVIGEPTGLVLWNMGAVTASDFSLSLFLPCMVAYVIPTWWIGRSLPDRIDVVYQPLPYRGDDTNLKIWQRVVMLFVGIGGLWFIPTFHSITQLSPFLGALCVLSVLWVVNEIFNRKLMDVDKMVSRRTPRVLQYGVIQMMLFVVGIMLALGVMQEIGVVDWMANVFDEYFYNVWLNGLLAGLFSSFLDNFATAMSFISFHEVVTDASIGHMMSFTQNGWFWKVIAYSSAVGGSIMSIGSMSGIALMKMERVRVGWYLKNVGAAALAGWIAGLLIMYFMS
ncbi:MAG: sodium:proton antiporter NhaD [Prevotella sp.]|nr:sodium:proton antiporter NhaD [Prevotella sp.]